MSNEATQPIDDGGPAFPSHGSMGEVTREGMSLRDWFAGQALAGLLAHPRVEDEYEMPDTFADHAYMYAEYMIEARQTRHFIGDTLANPANRDEAEDEP